MLSRSCIKDYAAVLPDIQAIKSIQNESFIPKDWSYAKEGQENNAQLNLQTSTASDNVDQDIDPFIKNRSDY